MTTRINETMHPREVLAARITDLEAEIANAEKLCQRLPDMRAEMIGLRDEWDALRPMVEAAGFAGFGSTASEETDEPEEIVIPVEATEEAAPCDPLADGADADAAEPLVDATVSDQIVAELGRLDVAVTDAEEVAVTYADPAHSYWTNRKLEPAE